MLPTVCTCAKLRRSARIVSAFYDEALAPAGISVAQFSLLQMLERAGPSSLSGFASATGLDRTTLNRTLKPLEKAGLVSSATGDDQRSRIVELSAAGAEHVRRAQPFWEAAQRRVEAQLGGERPALFALLDKVEGLRA
jgi:DNA-binding MarR family transcriptional regulator